MILKNSLLDSMFSLSFLSHEIWKVVGQNKEKQPSLLIVMRKRSNLLHGHNSSGCLDYKRVHISAEESVSIIPGCHLTPVTE